MKSQADPVITATTTIWCVTLKGSCVILITASGMWLCFVVFVLYTYSFYSLISTFFFTYGTARIAQFNCVDQWQLYEISELSQNSDLFYHFSQILTFFSEFKFKVFFNRAASILFHAIKTILLGSFHNFLNKQKKKIQNNQQIVLLLWSKKRSLEPQRAHVVSIMSFNMWVLKTSPANISFNITTQLSTYCYKWTHWYMRYMQRVSSLLMGESTGEWSDWFQLTGSQTHNLLWIREHIAGNSTKNTDKPSILFLYI